MGNASWGRDEVEILIHHYPDHGPSWVGWESILPGRTDKAIMRKANSLGLRSEVPRFRAGGSERKRPMRTERDPIDIMVERMMSDGMTPSEIDERLHWYRGTAIRVITGIWKGKR